MLRRLFTVLSALSLVLCLGVAVLWVRRGGPEDDFGGDNLIFTAGGRLWFVTSSTFGIRVLTVERWPGRERPRWVADDSGDRIPMVALNGPLKKWRRLGVNGEHGPVHTYLDFDGTPAPYSAKAVDRAAAPTRFAAVSVPHWMPIGLAAALPLLHVGLRVRGPMRRRRRAARRQCASCAYDLTGNVSGTCPECGMPTAPGGA